MQHRQADGQRAKPQVLDTSLPKLYILIGPDCEPYQSPTPGTLGGYKPRKIYGRLDCPSALRHIANGHYVRHRVFFADEETAIAAGYRPCAKCLPDQYRAWKNREAIEGSPTSFSPSGTSLS